MGLKNLSEPPNLHECLILCNTHTEGKRKQQECDLSPVLQEKALDETLPRPCSRKNTPSLVDTDPVNRDVSTVVKHSVSLGRVRSTTAIKTHCRKIVGGIPMGPGNPNEIWMTVWQRQWALCKDHCCGLWTRNTTM